jgi:hypothetical protein
MTARETGAVEMLKRELERQKVPFARCASENVVFIYNSPALDLAAMAAALTRPQPTPSATGGIVERLSLHSTWRDSHGELNDAPNIARALIEQQAATIAERDARIAVLREAGNELALTLKANKASLVAALSKRELELLMGDLHKWNCATLERTRGQ